MKVQHNIQQSTEIRHHPVSQSSNNTIQNMANELWGTANIHFLSLLKVYDNHTCAVISGHQDWTDYFLKHHFTHEIMYARTKIGQKRWCHSKNQALVNAEYDASMEFHIVGMLDVVKLSMHEVGCYDIYTFGVDRYNSVYAEDIYKKQKRHLLTFVPEFEQEAKTIILEQSRPNNRIAIKGKKFLDRYSHVEYWGDTWEHVTDKLGHEAHLFPAVFPVRD